jgi:hypothetical protein
MRRGGYRFGMSNSPQTRHRSARANSENGGFPRVIEARYFVAKTVIYVPLRKLLSDKLLILLLERVKGIEPS